MEEDLVASEVYFGENNEDFKAAFDSPQQPVLVVSNSWEDFIEQLIYITQFYRDSVFLKTDTGLSVASFRTLKFVSVPGKFKLKFFGRRNESLMRTATTRVITESSSVDKITVRELRESNASASTSFPSYEKETQSSQTEIAICLTSEESSAAISQLSTGNEGVPMVSETGATFPTYEVAAVAAHTKSRKRIAEDNDNLASSSCNDEVLDLGMHYHVPRIIRKMRLSHCKNEKTLSPDQLVQTLLTSPSYSAIKLLRKTVGRWLMLYCQEKYYPTKQEFVKMAMSVVQFFPAIGNPNSDNPSDIFYDPKSGTGQLEHYIRCKRSRDGLSKAKDNPKRRKIVVESDHTPEELRAMEIALRCERITASNKLTFLETFKKTMPTRIKLLEDQSISASTIVKRLPILVECLEAVDQDLEFLQGTTVLTFILKWRLVEAQIVEIAKKDLNNCPTARLYFAKWEEATNELVVLTGMNEGTYLVLHFLSLLLPNARFHVKNEDNALKAVKTIYQEFEDCNSRGEILNAIEDTMGTIGLVKIRGTFHLKVDGELFNLPIKQLDEALGYLIAYHFVLHNNYPPRTKFVFSFFERLLGVKSTVKSRAVDNIFSRLKF